MDKRYTFFKFDNLTTESEMRRYRCRDVLETTTFVNGTTINNTVQRCHGRNFNATLAEAAGRCGFCNAKCAYNAIEMCFIIGILANVLVIIRVRRDKQLRDPTFVAIAMLAIADLLFLLLNLSISFETIFRVVLCLEWTRKGPVFLSLYSICWFSANSHVALLAILRYITIAYPLQSYQRMTNRKVIACSGLVWILGFLIMGTLSLLIHLEVFESKRSEEYVIYQWISVYLLPLLITTVLHCVKICILKKTTKDSATAVTRKSIQRMSKIVVIVIVFAALLPVPELVANILKVSGRGAFPSREFRVHFSGIAQLLFLSNNFINPFLYCFLSKKFRNSLKTMFSCCHFQPEDVSLDTLDTPLSSRRNQIALENLRKKSESVQSMDDLDACTEVVANTGLDQSLESCVPGIGEDPTDSVRL